MGHASRQAVQLPHMSARGASAGRSRSVTSSPRKNQEPCSGWSRQAFLPQRAEAGGRGPGLLGDRAGVHVGAGLEGPGLGPQPLAQRGRASPSSRRGSRRPRRSARSSPGPRGRVGGVGVRRVVLEPHAQDRARPGEGRAQVAPLRDLARSGRPSRRRGRGATHSAKNASSGGASARAMPARSKPASRARALRARREGASRSRPGPYGQAAARPRAGRSGRPSSSTCSSRAWWAAREKAARARPPRARHSTRPVRASVPERVGPHDLLAPVVEDDAGLAGGRVEPQLRDLERRALDRHGQAAVALDEEGALVLEHEPRLQEAQRGQVGDAELTDAPAAVRTDANALGGRPPIGHGPV